MPPASPPPRHAHNTPPRYLPHLQSPEVLRMGLRSLGAETWIETDAEVGRYHRHKLAMREQRGDSVYRAAPSSLPAQRELATRVLEHLLQEQPQHYRREGSRLHCVPGGFDVALEADEALWSCSLWVADDLVIMQKAGAEYCLTAASLCSPSHWHLAEKFGRPLREIHDPIPGFQATLTPRVDRFFEQLRQGPAFVRFNWSLQAGDALAQFPGEDPPVDADTPLFYRTERQSLKRLPASGAIAFTIRVYLHPLEALLAAPDALPVLLRAVDATPEPLARYKGFPRLQAALKKYRELAG